ncbi:hypothetical protein MNR01_02715 [Lysobacter sp. S4-A87]|uniref:hypothetical protein n=1 Tax=Lysobacter sp. S4-A87 TaxID=2925843 RepID=UPI001F532DA4|nr:hypothetical protein [Lysobacter sp. S4-A87]UNK49970.1 hypothetical protein MNR01_02715 [Lysobacter sp. S4-A87]
MMRLLAALLIALSSMPAVAADTGMPAGETQRPVADPLVARHLDSLKYRYEVDEDGDYKLTFEVDDKRSQLAYVLSSTEKFGNLEVREIWSPAYRSGDGPFPVDVANRLLEDSQTSKLGGWVKQGSMAVFVVKIPADAAAGELDDALDFVLRSADQMEAALTQGKDEF